MFEDIQKLHHSNEKFKVSLYECCQNVLFFLFIRWAVGVSTGCKPRLEVMYSYTTFVLLMDEIRFTTSLTYLLYQFYNLCIFMKCLCVCAYKPVFVSLKPYDFHLWSHDNLWKKSFSRLHATCNLADYVLGIGAQGRQDASEASTLEPGILRLGVGCWVSGR